MTKLLPVASSRRLSNYATESSYSGLSIRTAISYPVELQLRVVVSQDLVNINFTFLQVLVPMTLISFPAKIIDESTTIYSTDISVSDKFHDIK